MIFFCRFKPFMTPEKSSKRYRNRKINRYLHDNELVKFAERHKQKIIISAPPRKRKTGSRSVGKRSLPEWTWMNNNNGWAKFYREKEPTNNS